MSLFSFFNNKKNNFYSQSGQDQFAYNLSGKNGTYLEIGAADPIINSNTYILEVLHNWKGVSIELDQSHMSSWKKFPERKNKIIWDNAFKINFEKVLYEEGIDKEINYLSCDIETPEENFKILKELHHFNFKFDFISFEHDRYKLGDKFEKQTKNFLLDNGYKIAIDDVYSRDKKKKIYETWFVGSKIDFIKIEYKDWKKALHKKHREN